MTQPSLTDFLLARIAEDEAVARAAADRDPEWEFRETAWHSWNVEARGSSGDFYGVTCDSEGLSDSVLTHDIGRHIARHDPARVLADVEAKRKIVERHRRASQAFDQSINPTTSGVAMTMDLVLADLASVYADHPDYRAEWRQ